MTYLKCKCGYREDGVCAIFFGWTCPKCGQVDSAKLKRKKN